jgi:hypothetical protein
MSKLGEVLPAVLTRGETTKLEQRAQQHYSRAQIGVVLFASDLAKLQEGNAHRVRGYSRFGEYVEKVFEGVTAANALQIVRQGQVLLKLERTGRLKLAESEKNLPGTTGLRELSAISKRFSDDVMLQTWDVAVATGRKVTSDTVLAALGTFIQAPAPPELETGEPEELTEDEELDAQEYGVSVTDKERELIDHIRDLSFELPSSLEEVEQAVKALRAEQNKDKATEDEK